MLTPDRWDKRCPRAREASRAELYDMLLVAAKEPHLFSGWERDFARSIREQLKYRLPTPRQVEILDRWLLRRCWINDPDGWSDPQPPLPLAHIIPNPSLKARWKTQRRMLDRARFNHDEELVEMLLRGLEDIEALMDAKSWVPPF